MLNGRLLTCSVLLSLVATVTGMPTGGCGANARFSPDGRSVAFQAENEGRLSVGVMELSDGTVKWIDRAPGIAAQPAVGSDGRIVYGYMQDDETAFAAEKRGSPEGFGLRIWERGEVRDLTRGRWRDYTPSFSADGESVYFATTRDQAQVGHNQRGASIWKLSLKDGTARCVVPMTTQNAGAIEPVESPDGRFLAWSQMNGFRDIWHVNVARTGDLGRVLQLTPDDMPAHAPAWSPCGRYLAFSACGSADSGWCVYTMNLSDGAMCNLGPGRNPSFSPDGRNIVCDDGKAWRTIPFDRDMRPTCPQSDGGCDKHIPPPAGETVFAAKGIPSGKSSLPLPAEADFGDGDFWVSMEVDCDPGVKGVRIGVNGAYLSHGNAFQLFYNSQSRWPGAMFVVRTAAGEWFGSHPAPLGEKGRHVLTGVRRGAYVALYIDGREQVRRPVTEGTCPAKGPIKVSFNVENGSLLSFACGRGRPVSVPVPSLAEFFGKEAQP